jgi:hypothetical protein
MDKGPVRDDALAHRDHVIAEIMSTEKVYHDKLKAIMEVLVIPLKEKNILSDDDMALQFNGLKVIYDVHKELYESMKHDSENGTLNIGNLFNRFSSRLQHYREYLVNFEAAITRRGVLLTKNRKFSHFVETASEDPRCCGCDVESLFIAPVQRITRYRLFLEDLLKYTPSDHPEHTLVARSLEKIKLVANQNNEAIRRRENREALMALMMKIDAKSRIDLLNNIKRVIVRQGVLRRQCR